MRKNKYVFVNKKNKKRKYELADLSKNFSLFKERREVAGERVENNNESSSSSNS